MNINSTHIQHSILDINDLSTYFSCYTKSNSVRYINLVADYAINTHESIKKYFPSLVSSHPIYRACESKWHTYEMLQSLQVNTPHSLLYSSADQPSLIDLSSLNNYDRLVIKPIYGHDSHDTHIIDSNDLNIALARCSTNTSYIIQPYTQGSLIK